MERILEARRREIEYTLGETFVFARGVSVLIVFPSLAAVAAFLVRTAGLGKTLRPSDGPCYMPKFRRRGMGRAGCKCCALQQ